MAEKDDKQAVAPPVEEQGNKSASDAQGAPDKETDWDELLAKYRDNVQGSEGSGNKAELERPKDLPRDPRVDELFERETRSDINRAVDFVRADSDVDRDLVEGFLNSRAEKQPEIRKAFENRYKDPSGWQGVLDGLKSDYQKVIQKLSGGGSADADKQAVLAAMNASRSGDVAQEPGVPKNIGAMSNAEFERYKASL